MKKILTSKITTAVALLVGYLDAVTFLRTVSSAYASHIGWGFPVERVFGNAIASLLVFMLCLYVFIVSILMSNRRVAIASAAKYPWRRVDWSLLLVLVYCLVSSIAFTMLYHPYMVTFFDHPVYLEPGLFNRTIIFSTVVYVTVMGMLAEILARIRDRQLLETLYWVRFFGLYPAKKPPGLFMAFLIALNLCALFVMYPLEAKVRINVLALVFAAFALFALAYLCSFLLSLAARYEKANEEKVMAERFKAELITNVSHDIRTPLTSVINYVDLLHALPIKDKQFRNYLGVLDRKTARLKTLINDLMDASKAGTGNVCVDVREINLGEIVGQVAGEFDDQFEERELALVFRQPEKPVLAQADSGHLWRTLENLFSNAAKYALPGTRVFAEISTADGRPAFSLKNTSETPIDLPAEELIEQFIRGDRARETEGSGLGLYIAKSLVELMGGSFNLRATGDLFEAEILFPRAVEGAKV
jgi:signal transduction histidine kinase